jgi:hypothetical protein
MIKTVTKAVLLSSLLMSGGFVRANDMNASPEEKVKKLTQELNLTTQQQSDIRTILDEQKTKKAAAATEAEKKTVQDETRQRIRAVLTDDQKAQFDKMKGEWKASHGAGSSSDKSTSGSSGTSGSSY